MKRLACLLPFIVGSIAVFAQKNTVFADVGIADAINQPAVSVTYDRMLIKYLGVGAGVDCFYNNTSNNTFNAVNRFIVSPYADIRGCFPIRRRGLIFTHLDIGVNFYSSEQTHYEVAHRNGFLTSTGVGYCYRITRRGAGPYASAKIVSNTYSAQQYHAGTATSVTSFDAIPVLSVGFKF